MDVRLENFTKRFGADTVIDGLDLTVQSGEMLALLGPSGCGKSTTLFAICGIHRMDGGRLYFGTEDVTARTSQERAVGVVFQSYALYPHMSVAENIGFPLRVRGDSLAERRRAVDEMAELVQIAPLLGRRPSELSGGQQQRVALARALVRRPSVLLLDEPLANLDAKLRLEMRAEIRRIQRETGITAVLVTHDQVEAMSMADRIAIMEAGRIVQAAPPMEMYADPASSFVAGFLGSPPISFLDGYVTGGQVMLDGDRVKLTSRRPDGPVRVGLRPEHIGPGGAARITGTVSFVEAHGRETLYSLTLGSGETLRVILPEPPRHGLGETLSWGIDPQHALFFDREGARLK